MTERFTKLYTMPSNLYLEGSPVIISAGALLLDISTDNVLALIKFKNIYKESISSVRVNIICYDNAKRLIGEPIEQTYLDLEAPHYCDFGHKVPVKLNDKSTRYIEVYVTEVVLTNGQIMNLPKEKWESLPEQQTMEENVGIFAAQQYQFELGSSHQFVPQKFKDLWLCSCSAVNKADNENCHSCNKSFDELTMLLNKDNLTEKHKERLYNEAVLCMQNSEYLESQAIFNKLKEYNYRDSTKQLETIADILKEQAQEQAKKKEISKKKKKKKILAVIIVGIIAGIVATVWSIVISPMLKSNEDYNKALKLRSEGKYQEAIEIFESLNGYKDSVTQIESIINIGLDLKNNGKLQEALTFFEMLGDYEACDSYVRDLRRQLLNRGVLSTSYDHTLCVKSDGTVMHAGSENYFRNEIYSWTDITAVSAGVLHDIGLKSDGTVIACGLNYTGKCDVQEWKEIIAVDVGYEHTVGLRSDGTVVAVGENIDGRCDVQEWTDIIAVTAGSQHTIGLKSDGTVVVAGYNNGQEVREWTDIVSVDANENVVIGLKSDGTVLATKLETSYYVDYYGEYEASEEHYVSSDVLQHWTDIVAITACDYHAIGLKSDGTVVAVGNNDYGQCNVHEWTDIIAVYADNNHTIGLKSDGTFETTGSNGHGQCDVQDWEDINFFCK